MNSCSFNRNVSIVGKVTGTPTNPVVYSRINVQSNNGEASTLVGPAFVNMVYDMASGANFLTIPSSTTINLDLTSGIVDPVNVSLLFGKVKGIYIEHLSGSGATAGVKFFGAGANAFQGPLSAGGTLTFLPGESQLLQSYTASGWTVGSTNKIIAIQNLSAFAAFVRIYVDGTN